MRLRPPLVLVLSALLVAAACADDADAGERDEALRALIAEDLVGSQEDGAITFDDGQADCVAEGLMGEFGGDQLREWGYDEEAGEAPEGDLTIDDGEQREQAWDVLVDCVDVTDQITGILVAGGALDEDESRCVAERYVDSDVAAHAVFGPADEEVNAEVDDLLETAVEACS
jgi:hypothetical protein